ncbi:MAG: carbohydrate ABC transporter permease, partial [Alkalispirochaeta sp.]
SLKDDPLEYPPSLTAPQLNPRNWAEAGRLGREGAGRPLFGGFTPGADVAFAFEVLVPDGYDAALDGPVAQVGIPRRRPGSGLGAVMAIDYAADWAELSVTRGDVTEVPPVDGESVGDLVTWHVRIQYPADSDGPMIDRVPLDITLGPGVRLASAELAPNRLERRGRIVSYDSIVPGSLGYIFHNYVRLFREARSVSSGESLFLRWMINSGIYAFFRVLSNVIFATMAGYALARYRFPGRTVVFFLVLFAQMVPAQVTFISNYLVVRDGVFGISRLFGINTLLNSMAGVIIGGAGASAFIEAGKVFIMKQFFETIPKSTEEAAVIDGAGHWQRFALVMFPQARPALGAVAILTFQGAWNDFFWPLVVLTSPEEIKTLPIGLLSFRQTYGAAGDWGLILSGAILSALPVVIMFIVFQRYFLQGISLGGSKE